MTVSAAPRQSVGGNIDDWTLLDAFVSLVIALAVTVLTLLVLGAALRQLDSRYSFSLTHAMNQTWAWVSILALSVLWLSSGLVHQMRSRRGPADREPATLAGETSDEDGAVFDQNHLDGRAPSHRPRAHREVAG
jgi:hypothetical protein